VLSNYNGYLKQPVAGMKEVGQLSSEKVKGHVEASSAGQETYLLGAKTRELVALAAAVTRRGDVIVHADAALRHGATREEISEALGVVATVNAGVRRSQFRNVETPVSTFGVRETHGILWRPDNRIHAASEGLGWSSLYASAQREAPYEGSFHAVRDHLVILHLDGPVAVCRVQGASQERRPVRPGGLLLLPGGLDYGVQFEGGIESVHVYLRDAVLHEVAAELLGGDPARIELVPRIGNHDPLIEQLALDIREILTDPDPASAVYADQLARTLGARLLYAHSNCIPHHAEPPRGGLTYTQLARAIEFMDANVAERLTLGEIAGAVGLSPAHFMRQFKISTRMGPHKYLVRLRMERAKRLLRETDRSIAQIAFECGFCNQEHMTRFFGQLAGATPAAFRRAVRTWLTGTH
jgi:AraC family transcriptional regulator